MEVQRVSVYECKRVRPREEGRWEGRLPLLKCRDRGKFCGCHGLKRELTLGDCKPQRKNSAFEGHSRGNISVSFPHVPQQRQGNNRAERDVDLLHNKVSWKADPHVPTYLRPWMTGSVWMICSLQTRKCVTVAYIGAFDCVSHEKLFTRLYTYGIQGDHSPVLLVLNHGSVLNWFKSYLSSRTFRVKCDNDFSSSCACVCGVPQGSVLGPLLFIMYTSPFSILISSLSLNHHLYADDTQLFLSSSI